MTEYTEEQIRAAYDETTGQALDGGCFLNRFIRNLTKPPVTFAEGEVVRAIRHLTSGGELIVYPPQEPNDWEAMRKLTTQESGAAPLIEAIESAVSILSNRHDLISKDCAESLHKAITHWHQQRGEG